MLRNYLKTAVRALRRRPVYTAINIVGLGVGLALCLLMVLYVQDELSYDRFHAKADRIVRVVLERELEGGRRTLDATTPPPLAPLMQQRLPSVEEAVRIYPAWGFDVKVQHDDQIFYESRVFRADSNFFDVFSLPLVRGNPQTALTRLRSVVLTQSTAQKYFGDEDPLGKVLTLTQGNATHGYTVTGIMADVPANSHFHFDLLLPIDTITPGLEEQWAFWSFYTYLLLEENQSMDDVRQGIAGLLEAYQVRLQGIRQEVQLQPLTDIHLHSDLRWEIEPNGDIRQVYLFAVLALLVLGIACINFTNLTTAQSMRRAKEVGTRLAIGGHRRQLVVQFLGEALLFSLLGLMLALALCAALLPISNNLTGRALTLASLWTGGWWLVVVGGVVLVGIVAGSYPAFVLASFRPAQVLKGTLRLSPRSTWFRRGLIVVQFAAAIGLLGAALLIWDQVEYIQQKKLGFDKERVVAIPLREIGVRDSTRLRTVKQSMQGLSAVQEVTASSGIPGGLNWDATLQAEGASEPVRAGLYEVDADFTETLGLDIVAGRDFSSELATDSTALVVNEAAVQALGLSQPIGKHVRWEANRQAYTIIGVVEDFHFRSLRHPIEPFVLSTTRLSGLQHLFVRLRPGVGHRALQNIEATWQEVVRDVPFAYRFLDQHFDQVHRAEQQLGRLVAYFAYAALVIACLGLFGLALLMTQQRTKEISIRKALGATVGSILALFYRHFARLILIAFVVAAPAVYVGMKQWLDGFAHHADLRFTVILFAGLATVGVTLLTVGYQALRAATIDPVQGLRDE